MRKIRASAPAMVPLRADMYGNASPLTSRSSTILASPAAARPGDRNRGPLLGDVDDAEIELRPQHLVPVGEAPRGQGRLGRGGGHEQAVFGEPGGGAVVEHHAVLAQHHAVAAAPDAEIAPAIDVDAFEELGCVRAGDLQLAERRHVDHADASAHLQRLAARAAVRQEMAAAFPASAPNDVTDADIGLAVREGYRSVEHVKRYTTLGMGTDQGKTSNAIGFALVAEALGSDMAAVGTTTYRPPARLLPRVGEAGRGLARGRQGDAGASGDMLQNRPVLAAMRWTGTGCLYQPHFYDAGPPRRERMASVLFAMAASEQDLVPSVRAEDAVALARRMISAETLA
jgi:Sarcosine oxidase A3 domain